MNKYLVIWAIDIEAEGPREAAREARKHQISKGTIAKVFDIYDKETLKPIETVDLVPHFSRFATYDPPKPIFTSPEIHNNGKETDSA